jgi:hypothetical protein
MTGKPNKPLYDAKAACAATGVTYVPPNPNFDPEKVNQKKR